MENAAFWERMYAANINRMIGLCHRYVNDLALAEDLAHEAFLKAMERADTYRATGNFQAWLMRITVNHAIQHLRQSLDTVPFVEEETPEVATEETSIWEVDFTQEELLEAVQHLPVPQRTVFNLYAIDGQSHAYIADLLNISIASSKETLYRARKRLREMLTQKAQEKEKRKKGVFVMILLFLLQHSEAARTDRLFRNGLSSLAYAPSKPLSTSQIQQAAEEAPSSPGVFVAAHRVALTTAAIAGIAGGVCAWQIARTSLDNSPLQEPVAPAESSVSLPANTIAENSLPSVSNSTTLENVVPYTIVESSLQTEPGSTTKPSEATVPVKQQESATKPQIIVVTKEIVVNDTVIVRDTAIVKDTVYLMQKP
ncbi:MAG: sigma-70 family RNA polymerase sigma factor [Bacteroidales bacterium]|nr:sigma-70 family RNA polymerase sigma factor [Bacteroidales bacterium]